MFKIKGNKTILTINPNAYNSFKFVLSFIKNNYKESFTHIVTDKCEIVSFKFGSHIILLENSYFSQKIKISYNGKYLVQRYYTGRYNDINDFLRSLSL